MEFFNRGYTTIVERVQERLTHTFLDETKATGFVS